jgi:hypothetical protein
MFLLMEESLLTKVWLKLWQFTWFFKDWANCQKTSPAAKATTGAKKGMFRHLQNIESSTGYPMTALSLATSLRND